MIKNYKLAALAALFIVFALPMAQAQKEVPIPDVSTDSLMKHIIELSSETYAGRMAGSNGYDKAARYAERLLRRYGAHPVRQEFRVECNEVENCKFNVYRPGSKEKRVFTLGNEFCCAGMTGRGYVDAQMVFCGYGIDNGVFDEFKKVDVQGKIAVVLTGLPEEGIVASNIAEHYATLRDKARTAEKHGAIGMMAVNISNSCRANEPQGRVFCGELPHLTTFPILHLTLDCAREIFNEELMGIDSAISQITRTRKPCSFALLKKAEIDVNAFYRPTAATTNVVGMLPGTDSRISDELIVIGASLDGVGMQGETCLFPGADINASGVAAVLEVARLLSKPDYRPKRSVVFVLFSGSEQQFLGSRVFLENYTKLRKIEAFLNVQNIGCGDSIVLLGDNKYPTLTDIAVNRDSIPGRHNIMHNPEKTNPRGDAKAFDAIGIPSMVFTTHNGMQHNRVSSDIWENIDRRILTMTAQLLVEATCELGEGLYQGRSPRSRAFRF